MDAVSHCGAFKWPLQSLPAREPMRREKNHNHNLSSESGSVLEFQVLLSLIDVWKHVSIQTDEMNILQRDKVVQKKSTMGKSSPD